MPDDSSKTAPAQETPVKQDTAPTEPSPPPVVDDAPWRTQVWVRGGTTTSGFDKMIHAAHQDAEERRAQKDEENRAVREEGARTFQHSFADSLDPKVLLRFDDAKWGRGEMLCELLTDDITGESLLVLVCPACRARGIPEDLCQLRVSFINRRFFVDTKERGKPGRYKDAWGRTQLYVKAGAIVDTDIIRCSQAFCDLSIRIDNDFIRRA